jgi:hypothetical protein
VSEHTKDCAWHRDWHACDCPYNYVNPRHEPKDCVYYLEGGPICPDCDPKGCLGVIPNTFIACGEMVQYCSQQCLEKAKANESMPKRPST